MIYKYSYTTSEEKQIIIDSNSSLTLIEEQNISEGNFLIFTDTPIQNPPVTPDIITQVNTIQDSLNNLKTQLGIS